MMTERDKTRLEQQLGWQEKEVVRHELLEKLRQFEQYAREKLSSFTHNLPEAEIVVVPDVSFIDYDPDEGDYFNHEEWGEIVAIFPQFKLYFKVVADKWDSALWKWLEDYEYEECQLKNLYTPILQAILSNIEKALEDYLRQAQESKQ